MSFNIDQRANKNNKKKQSIIFKVKYFYIYIFYNNSIII